MPSPRIRRLMLDYELLGRLLNDSPVIKISGTAGLPPEIYRFTYHLKSIYVAPSGDILERQDHLLEVNLTLDYPRRAPQCRMLTPIFHPNFDESSVCIGDFWAPSEGLDDLIFRIGRMIAFQEYNTKSPLNGLAAKWVTENAHLLPIDSRNVSPAAEAPTEPAPPQTAAPPTPLSPASGLTGQGTNASVRIDHARDDPWTTKIVIK